MDIAIGMDVDGPLEKTLERAAGLRERGFTRMWSSQIFDRTRSPSLPWSDASTRTSTSVPPSCDPNASPDDAGGPSAHRARGHRGRLSLGIGLSHKRRRGHVGISFDHPANYMGSTSKPSRRCCVANASTSTGSE